MKIKKYLIGIAISFSVIDHSYATTIDFNDLPQQIITRELQEESIGEGFLLGGKPLEDRVNFTSFLDSPNFSVFDLTGIGSEYTKPFNNFLIRYNLDASSNISSTNASGIISRTSLSGSVWLEAAKTLDLNNDNLVKVYRDKVKNLDSMPSWPLIFSFTAAAARSGSGNVSAPDFFGVYPGFSTQSGNVSVNGVFTCIECGFDITLNLIGLSYDGNGQSSFNLSDNRASLMTFHDFVDGGSNYTNINQTESLNVQPVPLPSSIGMFSAALLLLLFRVKRFNSIVAKLV